MILKMVSLRRRHGGGILLSVLCIAVVIATILAGLGTLIVSYYSRVTTDSVYANAINLADAGINYELRRISQNVANADLPTTGTPPGSTVSLGMGTFNVYCTMADGATSWDKSTTPFCIYSTGASGTGSRTVRVNATIAGSSSFAGIFAVVSASMNGNPEITGSIATDGTLSLIGNPTVTGNVIFDGPGAGWGSQGGSYGAVVTNPTAVVWPTTSAVALTKFPATGATAPGGLTYLSTHNDNATANPAIAGNSTGIAGHSTVTFVGKPGGANYYLTSLSTAGQSSLVFDNTNGPITIWCGPAGGNGDFKLTGGSAIVSMAADPSKAVRIYMATTSGITLTGNSELDAGVYNVTGGTSLVTLKGTSAAFNTTVITDQLQMSGTPNVTPQSGYFTPTSTGPYIFGGSWMELNGM